MLLGLQSQAGDGRGHVGVAGVFAVDGVVGRRVGGGGVGRCRGQGGGDAGHRGDDGGGVHAGSGLQAAHVEAHGRHAEEKDGQ